MRQFVVLAGVLVLLLGLSPAGVAATKPSAVTIVTAIDFSSVPFTGTFTVTTGSGILGCSSGTFVDTFTADGSIRKDLTCAVGGVGSFIVRFIPFVPNGHWEVLLGMGAFAGLRGQGDFSVVITSPTTGIETLTGVIHFDH